jgi:hypothetical protein
MPERKSTEFLTSSEISFLTSVPGKVPKGSNSFVWNLPPLFT